MQLQRFSPTPWNGLYPATKAAVHILTDSLWMECKPLGIHVTLIVAGGVKSNLVRNAIRPDVIPEDTLYPAYSSQILNILPKFEAMLHPTPAPVFAEKVVKGTMKRNPPRCMVLGKGSTLFWFLDWLSRTWVLSFLWWVVSRM